MSNVPERSDLRQGDPEASSQEGIKHVSGGTRALHEKHGLWPVQTGQVPVFGEGCGWSR